MDKSLNKHNDECGYPQNCVNKHINKWKRWQEKKKFVNLKELIKTTNDQLDHDSDCNYLRDVEQLKLKNEIVLAS